MEIQRTAPEDIEGVMALFDSARSFMRQSGNSAQWLDGYPTRELALADIEREQSYTVKRDGELLATFVLMLGDEPTYHIIEGAWLNDKPYGTLHRIASSGKARGISDFIIDWSFKRIQNLRGDTHEVNLPMQRAFERNGFKRCGTIWIEDGSPRIAYHKTV